MKTPTLNFLVATVSLIATLLSAQALADEQTTVIDNSIPWEEVIIGETDTDLSTWRRKIPGHEVKQFRGVIVLPHPAVAILKTLDTPEEMDDWVYFCRKGEHINGDLTYMEYKGIWPVASRYVALKSSVWVRDGAIFIQSRNVDSAGQDDRSMVRIPEFSNLFEITPLDANTTRVKFTTFVDLGGRLPSWIANGISSNAPKVTLRGLRDKLKEKEEYANATLEELTITDNRAAVQALLDEVSARGQG